MAAPFVDVAVDVFTGVVGSTAFVSGDLCYFDGTDWEKADSSDNTKFAEAMCIGNVSSGETASFTTKGVLVDNDAPYTQGDNYFLSETAGEITATRPTTATALKQVCAYGLSTSELRVTINAVYEKVVDLVQHGATSAQVEMDSGNLGGATLDADNESAFFNCMVPENCVGYEIAYMWSAVDATATTPTVGVFVGSSISGAQHDAITPDTTIASITAEGSAAHEVLRSDLTTAFDATSIIRPGALLGVHVFQEDSGTDITFIFNVTVVFLCV